MHTVSQMEGMHHAPQGLREGPVGRTEQHRDPVQGFIRLRIEHMQACPNNQTMRGQHPVIPFLQRAFGVNHHVRDVPHIPDFIHPLAHLQ